MKKISIYTRSGVTSPSSYYRILQYSKMFDGKIKNRYVVPDWLYKKHNNAKTKSDKLIWYSIFYFSIYFRLVYYLIQDILDDVDCVIISRAFSPKIILKPVDKLIECLLKKANKVVWDFDDDIFITKEITKKEASILLKYTTDIVVISEYLKNLLPDNIKEIVILMPTTDGDYTNSNIDELNQNRKATYHDEIILLWLATSTGLPHIHKIESILDVTAKKIMEDLNKQLVLKVICNKPFIFRAKYIKIENITWSKLVAEREIKTSHIGLMPLSNQLSSLGKGGFKVVQYMSVGLPSIASAIGFNNEVIKNEETGYLIDDIDSLDGWADAIFELSSNWNSYIKFSRNSLEFWNASFSYNKNLELWKEILN